jgi:hypothetical protein
MNENNKRLEVLYKKHDKWLRQVSWNICKDKNMVDDLVAELYLYLAEKKNEKIYYLDSFNLQYCRSFISSRFINRIKIENKFTNEVDDNRLEDDYDTQFDKGVDNTLQQIKTFLKQKQKGPKWVSAKIAELYYFGDKKTIEGLASEIGVSKSTIFLHIKSVRNEIKENFDNPFETNDDE